ncbi:MAG: hypothetical protein RJA34_2279 [Pseudomonadota bacterium]|jgi:DNA-binding response OmpR family regulator
MVASLNILVVEDHDALREATVDTLRQQGHQVTGIDSAEALIGELAGVRFDVYVIDLRLPGEDGISLTRRLRQDQPDAGIILATARVLPQDRAAGLASGADIYLAKPLLPEDLQAAVAELSRRKFG